MTEKTTKILVIGASYARMMAAIRLAGNTKSENVDITLINASNMFVERVRLHESATNRPLAKPSISQMLCGPTRVARYEGRPHSRFMGLMRWLVSYCFY